MKVNILADAEWQSGVGGVLNWLATTNYWAEFEDRDYGLGLNAVVIGLICRDPKFNFRQRVRFSRKDKTLYADVMLNLADFVEATVPQRKNMAISALLNNVPVIVERYKIEDFDKSSFLIDFCRKFKELLGET